MSEDPRVIPNPAPLQKHRTPPFVVRPFPQDSLQRNSDLTTEQATGSAPDELTVNLLQVE